MAQISFNQFIKKWEEEILPKEPKFIRKGQSLINYLGDIWFEEYKRISSVHYYTQTNIDCFYNDKLIPNTLYHLKKEWYKYPN